MVPDPRLAAAAAKLALLSSPLPSRSDPPDLAQTRRLALSRRRCADHFRRRSAPRVVGGSGGLLRGVFIALARSRAGSVRRRGMSSWKMLGGEPPELADECCYVCKDGGDDLRPCDFR